MSYTSAHFSLVIAILIATLRASEHYPDVLTKSRKAASGLTFGMLSTWPPLWSSVQSSWLQIQRSWFDFRRYQIFWEVVGLERDPISLVSTIEEQEEVAAPV
jgi:hypothetical protein